jgi:phage gp29-like protein
LKSLSNKKKAKAQQSAAPPINSKRPDLNEIAVAQVQDKYSGYPSNGLTPVRLANIFREADAGDVLRQMELFEEMEEKDPHLFSQLQTRKNAVTGLDYEVIPFSDEDEDKAIAEFVSNEINSIENFEDVEMDLLDAIGKGFAVSEIIWGYSSGKTTIEEIKNRHQKRFFWDSVDDSFKVMTKENPSGIIIPENKFIVHRYKARSGHPSRAGVLRVVAWMYLFKNYDIKDWVSFCEVFGMPLRLGKYAPGASEEDKAALIKALVQIGSDAAGIIPDGTEIKFEESGKTSSIDVYERLARYCDEQVSKAILGQTLTSDSGGGSFAQSKTHNEVRHDLTVADCKALASTLRRDLIRPLVQFNFGEGQRIPYIRFDCKESEDLKEAADILTVLIQGTGLKVPTSYLYKKFSIPEPQEGDEVAAPPAAPPAAQPQGAPVPFKALFPAVAPIALKSPPTPSSQAQVDNLADHVVAKNAGTFQDMFAPVLKLVDKAGSLEDLKNMLSDDKTVEELCTGMNASDFEALLQKAMFLADLQGRSMGNG